MADKSDFGKTIYVAYCGGQYIVYDTLQDALDDSR